MTDESMRLIHNAIVVTCVTCLAIALKTGYCYF